MGAITKAKIAEFVECVDGYTTDQENFLREVKAQIDRLGDKFVKAQRLGFSSLKDVDKVITGLNEHKIGRQESQDESRRR